MLNPQEFEELKKILKSEKALSLRDLAGIKPSDEPGFFSRVGQQYQNIAENIISDIKRPAESAAAGAGILEVTKQIGEVGLRTAGGIARATFAPIVEAVAPAIKPLIEKLIEIPGVSNVAKGIKQWADENPEAAKDAGALFDILASLGGEAVVPSAKKIAGSMTILTGKGVEKAGQEAKKLAERAYRLAAPMKEATARAVQTYQASKPTLVERLFGTAKKGELALPIRESETAARVGLSGTEWQIGVQAKRASQKLWDDTIGPALSSSKEKISMKEFFSDLKKRIVAETPELGRKNSLLEALDAMKEDFKNVSSISLSKLQDYKSGWAKFIPERAYKGKPIAGTLNEVRNTAAQEARAIIYDKLGESIKQAYLDYGNLQSIIESGIKSVDPLRSKSAFKQAWEFIVDKTIIPISSYGGKTLYKTGEGLEFVGKEGLKKLGDLLKN